MTKAWAPPFKKNWLTAWATSPKLLDSASKAVAPEEAAEPRLVIGEAEQFDRLVELLGLERVRVADEDRDRRGRRRDRVGRARQLFDVNARKRRLDRHGCSPLSSRLVRPGSLGVEPSPSRGPCTDPRPPAGRRPPEAAGPRRLFDGQDRGINPRVACPAEIKTRDTNRFDDPFLPGSSFVVEFGHHWIRRDANRSNREVQIEESFFRRHDDTTTGEVAESLLKPGECEVITRSGSPSTTTPTTTR